MSLFVFLGLILTSVAALDPDIDLDTPQMIRRYGYPAESHTIETKDGYLLTLHRIPYNNGAKREKRPVVLLQHGLLGSSAGWVLLRPPKALPYVLSEKGYDVWLSNVRGNSYSRAHVSLNPSQPEFWNFSWDEMAKYDLPATIDYILNETDQKTLSYVGHSMGTTMFFAMASTQTEYNRKIKIMIALAPVAYVDHMRSPIRYLAPIADDIEFIAHFIGKDAFLPQNGLTKLLSKYFCDKLYIENICQNILFVIAGFDPKQFDMDMLSRVLSHAPAGTSTKSVLHYAQEILSGNFGQFDFGPKGNQIAYNSSTPPVYNLTSITAPISLFSSDNDLLVSKTDLSRLSQQIRYKAEQIIVPYPGFNHLDYIWAKDAEKLVYRDVVRILENFKEEA